jgi:hypothetical protein
MGQTKLQVKKSSTKEGHVFDLKRRRMESTRTRIVEAENHIPQLRSEVNID